MTGAYQTVRKDGTEIFRSNITHNGVHVSLGSFPTEKEAAEAYEDACRLYEDPSVDILNYRSILRSLSWEKAVSILNHRDHGIYVRTPVYLRTDYISYFIAPDRELKFDTDDFFYYSQHRILSRNGGSFYVNDYGSQYRILGRYGIKSYAVRGRDYDFVNGDPTDFRRANIRVLIHYPGVFQSEAGTGGPFEARIHLHGDFRIGVFDTEEEAAVAYNKACDYAIQKGAKRRFPQAYIPNLSGKRYAEIYERIRLPGRFRKAVHDISNTGKTGERK